MWETTGKLAEKIGLSLPGMEGSKQANRPATRCPNCEQKLRYTASKAGSEVKCPRCAHRFPLPVKPQSVRPKFSAKVGYSEIRHRL
jgi:DNA-directed RNA polymerase subunit RPC12/RpoP